jgi:hypothetical protein
MVKRIREKSNIILKELDWTDPQVRKEGREETSRPSF